MRPKRDSGSLEAISLHPTGRSDVSGEGTSRKRLFPTTGPFVHRENTASFVEISGTGGADRVHPSLRRRGQAPGRRRHNREPGRRGGLSRTVGPPDPVSDDEDAESRSGNVRVDAGSGTRAEVTPKSGGRPDPGEEAAEDGFPRRDGGTRERCHRTFRTHRRLACPLPTPHLGARRADLTPRPRPDPLLPLLPPPPGTRAGWGEHERWTVLCSPLSREILLSRRGGGGKGPLVSRLLLPLGFPLSFPPHAPAGRAKGNPVRTSLPSPAPAPKGSERRTPRGRNRGPRKGRGPRERDGPPTAHATPRGPSCPYAPRRPRRVPGSPQRSASPASVLDLAETEGGTPIVGAKGSGLQGLGERPGVALGPHPRDSWAQEWRREAEAEAEAEREVVAAEDPRGASPSLGARAEARAREGPGSRRRGSKGAHLSDGPAACLRPRPTAGGPRAPTLLRSRHEALPLPSPASSSFPSSV